VVEHEIYDGTNCIEYETADTINKLFNVELAFFSVLDKIILQSKLKM